MLLARQQVRIYHLFFWKRKKLSLFKERKHFLFLTKPPTHKLKPPPTTTTPPQGPLPVKLSRPGPYPCISGCTPLPSGPAGSGMSVGGVKTYCAQSGNGCMGWCCMEGQR